MTKRPYTEWDDAKVAEHFVEMATLLAAEFRYGRMADCSDLSLIIRAMHLEMEMRA